MPGLESPSCQNAEVCRKVTGTGIPPVSFLASSGSNDGHGCRNTGPSFPNSSQISCERYGAKGASFSEQATAKLEQFTKLGYGKFPVCIAKTQYSLTDDPKRLGAPTGWTLNVTDASVSAGAGFVVVIVLRGRQCGRPGVYY